MNSAAPLDPLALTAKSVVAFATMPVGLKGTLPAPAGRVTTFAPEADSAFPLPSYKVEVCVPLLATHTASPGAIDTPHGLMRFGSTFRAEVPAASATRLVSEYGPLAVPAATVKVTDFAVPAQVSV